MGRLMAAAALAAGLVGGGLVAAAPASAAQDTQVFDCGGTPTALRVATNNSSDNGGWGVGQVVSGGTGHLIPTSFGFSAFDVTQGVSLFAGTQDKGRGNANANQAQITCTQTQTGVLADLLGPGDTPPPGAALTDIVTVTFTVTAVPKA